MRSSWACALLSLLRGLRLLHLQSSCEGVHERGDGGSGVGWGGITAAGEQTEGL
jgi:hypothetical protein